MADGSPCYYRTAAATMSACTSGTVGASRDSRRMTADGVDLLGGRRARDPCTVCLDRQSAAAPRLWLRPARHTAFQLDAQALGNLQSLDGLRASVRRKAEQQVSSILGQVKRHADTFARPFARPWLTSTPRPSSRWPTASTWKPPPHQTVNTSQSSSRQAAFNHLPEGKALPAFGDHRPPTRIKGSHPCRTRQPVTR